MADEARGVARQERGLRRELRFGEAVSLVFVLATVGILFVSYAFIRLTSYFNHAGYVY